MSEFIPRIAALGFGKEVTAGTKVAATVWLPRESGSAIIPKTETAEEQSARGSIVDINDEIVAKAWSEIPLGGAIGDITIGHVLLAALGSVTVNALMQITGAGGGSPAVGDVVTSATGSWSANIVKEYVVGATTYFVMFVNSGSLSDQTDLTNGTWTGGTGVIAVGATAHLFTIDQTSSNHQSYTAWENSPAGHYSAAYAMLNTFTLSSAIQDYVKFTAQYLAQQEVSEGSTATVAYVDEDLFSFADGEIKFADAVSGLEAASVATLQRMEININKNLNTDAGQKIGQESIEKLFNQNFGFGGTIEALFEDNTYKDYATNATKKAARLKLINTRVSFLYDGPDDIYPTIEITLNKVSFSEFAPTDDLNTISSQTLNIKGLKSGTTVDIMLINSQAVTY